MLLNTAHQWQQRRLNQILTSQNAPLLENCVFIVSSVWQITLLCGLATPYGDKVCVNIGSGNAL